MRGRMALLLGLAMLPAGAIATQVGLNAVSARQAAYEETLSRRALQSISVESGVIDEMRQMTRVLATTPALQQIHAGDCREWLSDVVARYPYVTALAVTTNVGGVQCSFPPVPPTVSSRSELFERARARDAFTIGYIESGLITAQPGLAALEPVREGGRRLGFIYAAISVAKLEDLISRGRALDGARAAIVDSTGRIVAASEPPAAAPEVGLPRPDQIRNLLGPEPAFVPVEHGDAVIVPLHPPDLYAVRSWASDQPAWRRWGEITFSLAAPILIWMLAVAAGWFAIEIFVARPLSELET